MADVCSALRMDRWSREATGQRDRMKVVDVRRKENSEAPEGNNWTTLFMSGF